MFQRPGKSSNDSGSSDHEGRNRILLEAMADLSATLDLDQVLDRILARSLELSGAERALLLLGDAQRGVQARQAKRADGREIQAEEVAFSTTMVKRALKDGHPITEEMDSDSEALAASQSVFELRLRSVMCAPMSFRGEVLGAIYLDSKVHRKTFAKADRELFEALARQAAIALKNARLLQQAEERARMKAELTLAAEIQGDLLPAEAPRVPGLEIAGRCLPCEELSGDTFDFVVLEDGRLLLYVADVTGHGVGPALLAAEVRGEIRALAGIEPDPGAILRRVHENLRQTVDPGRFLTLFLALLEPQSRRLRFASAGHSEVLLLNQGEGRFLGNTGPPLGVDVDVEHQTQELADLAPGTVLVAFSDGLVEARNADGECFGQDRLIAYAVQGGNSERIVTGILEEVDAFTGGTRDDDRTVIAATFQA